LALFGLGLLQLTWFLSSLYLGALYLTLFFGPRLRNLTSLSAVRIDGSRERRLLALLRGRPDLNLIRYRGHSGWFLVLAWLGLAALV